jgi:LCP family protein required for cell wall assembly
VAPSLTDPLGERPHEMLRPNGPPRRRRRVLWAVTWVVAAGVIAATTVGIYLYSLAETFNSGRHVAASPFPTARPPASTGQAARAVNILLLGIDDHSVEAKPAGLSSRAADMIAVLHIPASHDHIYLMSILRNSAVTLPHVGSGPISAALAEGGIPLQVEAVERLVGVRMDHVSAIAIPGFKGLTDAMGGVTVNSPTGFTNEGYSFHTGKQKLNGKEAVAFVRRGGDAVVDDATRAQAQEAFVRGALNDFLSAKTLLNPAAVMSVVSVMSPYMTVDKGLDAGYLGTLGVELRNLHSADVSVFRLPTAGPRRVGGVDVLNIDHKRLSDLRQHLRSDTLDEYSH